MKLIIEDLGDPTVGIFSRTFIIECPFEFGNVEIDEMKIFKEDMVEIYKDYADGNIIAQYDMSVHQNISTKTDYDKLLASGMFNDFYPELSGDWEIDESIIFSS